ncbi:uncharacterized protein LOC132884496 [Neoarius graeffei]|uniref:uncharacterized protein LOC132884496 n=1 Tax=Neoarius graeffei TaxID=443677 RepID=UPI00298C1348|nr:uncharacterized protein LOC132884496 [Neoarius graeffei]
MLLLLVFFSITDIEAADNSIKSDQTNVFSTEGSNTTLSCTYTGYTGTDNRLHWYRQKPGSRPEFLLLILESSGSVIHTQPPHPRLSIKLDKTSKKVDLLISSAAVTDSALYQYTFFPMTGDSMADTIQPLVTHTVKNEGNEVTLSCSYKGFSGSVYSLHCGSLSPNTSPRISAKLNKDKKQVDLLISSAAVSDSALYYCALQPTVTANRTALYKDFHTVLLY